MQSKRYTLIFIFTAVFFIVINTAVSFTGFNSNRYFEYGKKVYSREMIINADRYISSLKISEYEREHNKLLEEYYSLGRYLIAIKRLSDDQEKYQYYSQISEKEAKEITEKCNMSVTETEYKIQVNELCRRQLKYAETYSDYLENVRTNAEKMNSSSIFSSDSKKKILSTGAEFYKLDNIEILPLSDEEIKTAFNDRITDIFAVLSVLICSFVFSLKLKSGAVLKRTGFFGYVLLACVSVFLIYILNIVCADYIFQGGHFDRTVQSLRIFQLCPVRISLGGFILLRTAVKTAACMTLFFISAAVFSAEKKKILLSGMAVFAVTEAVRYFNGNSINCISLWKPENILGQYGNVKIFGEYVSTYSLYLLYAAVLLVISVFTAVRVIRLSVISAAERFEQEYFDEINRKYNESRFIRHDIQNHLSAIAVLLDSGDTEAARRYIGEVSDELERIKPPVKTGSNVLDALLFKKYSLAGEEGIKIYTEFLSDFSSCRFSDYDLCGIFSNILDNAFEACSKLEDDKKFVTLSVKEQMNMVCIICENPYSEIKKTSEGFITLKPDRSTHGLGLKRILRIAEKYGGSVETETEDNIFTVSVLMMKRGSFISAERN